MTYNMRKEMKFLRCAILVAAALGLFGCQSASQPGPALAATPEPTIERPFTLYFYWDAPRRKPGSVAIEINEKRIAIAEEKEILSFPVQSGKVRLKVGYSGVRGFGSPKATVSVTASPEEKRYFLFTAKVVPNIPLVTPQGVYGVVRDAVSLVEVDSAEFARVAGPIIK